eukprot:3776278-Pleurochrysis_carterae.AAC.1
MKRLLVPWSSAPSSPARSSASDEKPRVDLASPACSYASRGVSEMDCSLATASWRVRSKQSSSAAVTFKLSGAPTETSSAYSRVCRLWCAARWPANGSISGSHLPFSPFAYSSCAAQYMRIMCIWSHVYRDE